MCFFFFQFVYMVNYIEDHSNSNKGKYLMGDLKFRGLIHYHHVGPWQHESRHGVGEGAERSTSCTNNRK